MNDIIVYQTVDWQDIKDPAIFEKEKGKREPFTSSSPPPTASTASTIPASTTPFPPFLLAPSSSENVSQNISTIQGLQRNFATTGEALQKQQIRADEVTPNLIYLKNDKYHYFDKNHHDPQPQTDIRPIQYDSDPNVLIRPEESKDIKTAIQQDVNQLKIYQNSIYITATIAGASLLIASILLTKK